MYSFSYLEPVCCSMSSSNCCFLTCIQIPQEAVQVVWYSHLFLNFSQFIVIHTVKDFGIVNTAEIDVFLVLSCFFLTMHLMLAIWSLVPLPFLKPAWTYVYLIWQIRHDIMTLWFYVIPSTYNSDSSFLTCIYLLNSHTSFKILIHMPFHEDF